MEKKRKYMLAFAFFVVGLTIFYLQNFANSYCVYSLLPKSKAVQNAFIKPSENKRDSVLKVSNAYSFNKVLWNKPNQIPVKRKC